MKLSETVVSYDKLAKSLKEIQNKPFKTVLDLNVLIESWQEYLNKSNSINEPLREQVYKSIQLSDELIGPIEDLSVIEKNKELLDLLFLMVFPASTSNSDISAAIIPFSYKTIYETPGFKKLFKNFGSLNKPNSSFQVNINELEYFKAVSGYSSIGQKFYNLDIQFDFPFILTIPNSNTGMNRYFKVEFDTRFIRIVTPGELPKLTASDKQRLLNNLADVKTWMEILPPENFEFHGFGIFKLIDVTSQEVISELKRNLIEKESILSDTRFEHIQQNLRVLLKLPKLYLGLVAFQNSDAILLNSGYKPEKSCTSDTLQFRYKRSEFIGTIYDCNLCQTEIRVIEDVLNIENPTFIEKKIIEYGLRSIIVAPLFYQDKLIGGLEIASPNPGDLNELNAIKISSVLPLFSLAIQQTLEELNHQIQNIIKEKFTFVHPSVEWRFQKAAIELLEKRKFNPSAEISDIVFENVIPLYSISDIRSSTMKRNLAITQDLIQQLEMAKICLDKACEIKSIPLFDELKFRIKKKMDKLAEGLRTEDENVVLEFLRNEIEPVFEYITQLDSSLIKYTEAYHKALDPNFGIVYRHRKAYDESVNKIADTISCYLEAQEIKAQEMCPHFFEKHKTDGVDFNLYVGKSLVEDGFFSPICLKNLRLWQLIVMCGIVQKTEEIKHTLPLPLEIAHLILIQDNPLSIRFKPDERQFDVDGSYNVRYEIMKKRIDKSVVKNTEERVTQPGKIALIYSSPREIMEYRASIEYLQSCGFLEPMVEEIELEDLQGIQGLKALRITVKTNKTARKSHEKLIQDFPVLN